MTSTCVKMIHSLYKQGGEGSPCNPVKFKGQDFKQLKETLLREGKKFEDETFPANIDSLGQFEELTAEQLKEVKWCRPHELNPNPSFVVDGVSRFDFQQGFVGNCWFLSSIGALTKRKSLMVQVVLPDQSFKDNYVGIFHFRFWRFGKWVDVVIDDLLPTLYEQLVSVSSKSGTEFWPPLLEKAYAKVCGSYGDMIAGLPPEALKDFSGGVHMNYKLSKPPPDLWDVMIRATQCKTMMACGTFSGEKGEEYSNKFGLVAGHAFAVTAVKQVESQGKKVNLVRIWNPWGEKEWTGDWSDQSTLWSTVSEEVQEECLKVRDDGEFWMTLEDLCTYFEELDICCDSPNFVDDDAVCQWNCSVKEGRWEAGKSAGGGDYDTEGFWTNPQYRLTVKEIKGGNNILLSLLQKPDEEYRSKVVYYYIGFTIYKVPSGAPKGRLSSSDLKDAPPPKESIMDKKREKIEMHSLEPGEYLIIPSTYDPGKTASFIITVYSKAETEIE
ncbi:calpain-1 catalytic subunit-like [Acanthochromis polyacanthus]|uniref:Calpain-1 catalytic subunit-like n=1 Tax=Acanthochromis polyacanthus TaxID=80966 RepID=A0A3Q1FDS1_9TELE|nr:calpain-1 catalytic subunit-like [Acanthochromis polyacanthus]XP_022063833.1 calpain-1 catalytic subunit-like [Acanthochromis polyacanthus]